MSERTVEAGSHCALNLCADKRWSESDALDPTFEEPPKAQVVFIKDRGRLAALHRHGCFSDPKLTSSSVQPLARDVAVEQFEVGR